MKNNISKSKIIIAVISVITALAVFISIGWYFSYQENTNELRRLSDYISEFRYGPQPTYVTFGKYEQDGNVLNGKEDIEWKVILVNSGQVFLVSRCILDCKPFFSESGKEEMTATGGADVPKSIWETSSLRKWLNEDFYENAFNDQQKAIIQSVTTNSNYLSTTSDKVFLLSGKEWKEDYWNDDLVKITDYAKNQGIGTAFEVLGCSYWLRSSYETWDKNSERSLATYTDEIEKELGELPVTRCCGVRPAIKIDVSEKNLDKLFG